MTRLPALALMAHDVHGPDDTSGTAVAAGSSIPLSLLIDTVEALRARGYRFVKLAEFLAARDAGGVALLTFDDGYAGLQTRALPALRGLGIPALCFLVTETLDSSDCFPLWLFALRDAFAEAPHTARSRLEANPDVCGLLAELGASSLQDVLARPARELFGNFYPRLSYAALDRLRAEVEELGILRRLTLDREGILEMRASGVFEFGAHSVGHRNLLQVPPAEARRQVTESIRSVAQLSGAEPRTVAFAYPYGVVSPPARRAVEEMGCAGFTVAERAVHRADRLSALPRLSLDETAIERAARPPRSLSLIEERIRVRMAPLREHARVAVNRLRRSRSRRVASPATRDQR